MKPAYTLTLTKNEYQGLLWLEGHGYTAELIHYATACDEAEDGTVVLRYTESAAWAVRDEYDSDPDAFAACASRDLASKMFAFLYGIV